LSPRRDRRASGGHTGILRGKEKIGKCLTISPIGAHATRKESASAGIREADSGTRGGIDERTYKVEFTKKTFDLVVRQWPDGKLEQFMLLPK
jgi:hypothetical protein